MASRPEPRPKPVPVSGAQVTALRTFNRFYTQRAGILAPYLGSTLSLTEVRVLYELAQHAPPAGEALGAARLGALLGLDAGYLSRILRRFEARSWLKRARSVTDARQSQLTLTRAGHAAFAPLQKKLCEEAAALLAPLPEHHRLQLVDAFTTVHRLLDPDATAARLPSAILREPKAGDMGWVVQQHGEIYAREYGWNAEFEALVAGIVARYIRHHRSACERCWIAELAGERVGAAFVVRKSKTVAQLRMLILTPQARGLGLGARLCDECISFARAKGYKKMVLWTNSCLDAARGIYRRRGFVLVKSEPYRGYGHDLVGETWELRL